MLLVKNCLWSEQVVFISLPKTEFTSDAVRMWFKTLIMWLYCWYALLVMYL